MAVQILKKNFFCWPPPEKIFFALFIIYIYITINFVKYSSVNDIIISMLKFVDCNNLILGYIKMHEYKSNQHKNVIKNDDFYLEVHK